MYYCWRYNNSKELILGRTDLLTENKIQNLVLHEFPDYSNRFAILYYTKVFQYAIGEDTYIYLANQKRNTDEIGSIFAPIPSEMESNITCISSPDIPVIGFIEVSKGSQIETFLESPNPLYDPPSETYCFLQPPLRESIPIQYLIYPDPLMLAEPQCICIDCRIFGGGGSSTTRPKWWPNDYK